MLTKATVTALRRAFFDNKVNQTKALQAIAGLFHLAETRNLLTEASNTLTEGYYNLTETYYNLTEACFTLAEG
jgi:hypothetical protein